MSLTAALLIFIGALAIFGIGLRIGRWLQQPTIDELKARIAPFDADGDGRPRGKPQEGVLMTDDEARRVSMLKRLAFNAWKTANAARLKARPLEQEAAQLRDDEAAARQELEDLNTMITMLGGVPTDHDADADRQSRMITGGQARAFVPGQSGWMSQ